MAIEARIRELGLKHRTLDRFIESEAGHPSFDDLKLRQLKVRKLRLKEEMESLRLRAN